MSIWIWSSNNSKQTRVLNICANLGFICGMRIMYVYVGIAIDMFLKVFKSFQWYVCCTHTRKTEVIQKLTRCWAKPAPTLSDFICDINSGQSCIDRNLFLIHQFLNPYANNLLYYEEAQTCFLQEVEEWFKIPANYFHWNLLIVDYLISLMRRNLLDCRYWFLVEDWNFSITCPNHTFSDSLLLMS